MSYVTGSTIKELREKGRLPKKSLQKKSMEYFMLTATDMECLESWSENDYKMSKQQIILAQRRVKVIEIRIL